MESLRILLSHLPFSWAGYGFMQNALLAVLLISPLFALLGCLVLNRQMAFYSEAIGHAALTGIALGVVLGLGDPLLSMVLFSLTIALVISFLRRYSRSSSDTIIGLTMSFAVALGVVLLSRGGGFNKYSRYLIGDILTISPAEIKHLALVVILVLVIWLLFFNRIFFVSVNATLAKSRGLNVWLIEVLFAIVVAIVVTVCIPWVGLLVINSLLILPAAAARNVAANTRQYLLSAAAVSWLAGIAGLVLSFYWGTAAGATIVLTAMAVYLLTLIPRCL